MKKSIIQSLITTYNTNNPSLTPISTTKTNNYSLSPTQYQNPTNPPHQHLQLTPLKSLTTSTTRINPYPPKSLNPQPQTPNQTNTLYLKTSALTPNQLTPSISPLTTIPTTSPHKPQTLKPLTILISKDGNIGESTIIPTKTTTILTTPAIITLTPTKHPLYLIAILKHLYFKQQIHTKTPLGIGIRHTPLNTILNTLIPLPTQNQQTTIHYIETISQAIITTELLINKKTSTLITTLHNSIPNNQPLQPTLNPLLQTHFTSTQLQTITLNHLNQPTTTTIQTLKQLNTISPSTSNTHPTLKTIKQHHPNTTPKTLQFLTHPSPQTTSSISISKTPPFQTSITIHNHQQPPINRPTITLHHQNPQLTCLLKTYIDYLTLSNTILHLQPTHLIPKLTTKTILNLPTPLPNQHTLTTILTTLHNPIPYQPPQNPLKFLPYHTTYLKSAGILQLQTTHHYLITLLHNTINKLLHNQPLTLSYNPLNP